MLLTNCGPPRIYYYDLYSECSLSNKSFTESAKCASKQRRDYLNETGNRPDEDDDSFESYVNLLAERVNNKEISEAEAKHLVIEERNRRKAAARAAFNNMMRGIGEEFSGDKKKNSNQNLKTY